MLRTPEQFDSRENADGSPQTLMQRIGTAISSIKRRIQLSMEGENFERLVCSFDMEGHVMHVHYDPASSKLTMTMMLADGSWEKLWSTTLESGFSINASKDGERITIRHSAADEPIVLMARTGNVDLDPPAPEPITTLPRKASHNPFPYRDPLISPDISVVDMSMDTVSPQSEGQLEDGRGRERSSYADPHITATDGEFINVVRKIRYRRADGKEGDMTFIG